MTKKSVVPEVRFKGFAGEWEERMLGELGNVAMNRRIFKHETSEVGDVPFYKIGTFGKMADAFISRALFEEYKSKYPYPTCGDLLISASGSIGNVVEYAGKDEYFQDSNIVWLQHDNNVANSFLKQFYLIVKWHGLEGSTIKRLYNSNILRTNIFLPSSSEQTRIGELFRDLDARITLEQRKHEKLQNIKKAMLEKMFPKPGATVPEVRFKGCEEEWEEKNLGDLSSKFQSGEFIKANEIAQNGPYPVFGGNGLRGYANTYNHDGEFTLIGRQGALCGNVKYIFEQAYITEHAVAVSANSDNSTLFLYYLFGIMNLGQYSGQSAQPGLAVGNLILLNAIVPKKTEQTRIGEFFRNLDKLITLQQRKCEKMQNIKKAMLGKMFV